MSSIWVVASEPACAHGAVVEGGPVLRKAGVPEIPEALMEIVIALTGASGSMYGVACWTRSQSGWQAHRHPDRDGEKVLRNRDGLKHRTSGSAPSASSAMTTWPAIAPEAPLDPWSSALHMSTARR